jgi:hypothetical protein
MNARLLVTALAIPILSCGGSTGGARVIFPAFATAAVNAPGGTLEFTNGLGYHVVLTRARLHVGTIYLKTAVPIPGAQPSACYVGNTPGLYAAEVLGSLDVDALSSALQPFPVQGDGNTAPVHVGELWLTGGPINTIDDSTVILNAAGTADRAGVSYPFQASLTIGRNRLISSSDPAQPSLNPICKQRIVTPIPAELTPQPGGMLVLRIDPRSWFAGVDFSLLSQFGGVYQFSDSGVTLADVNLYNGFRSTTGVYQFTWQ